MKIIKASNQPYDEIDAQIIEKIVEDMANILYPVGYKVTANKTSNEGLIEVKRTKVDAHPTINLTVSQEDSKAYVDATLAFPELTTVDTQYYDSIEYHLEEWARIGKAITEIASYELDINDYIEENL